MKGRCWRFPRQERHCIPCATGFTKLQLTEPVYDGIKAVSVNFDGANEAVILWA